MGLTSSLLIGRSALQASQSAIQVTGNNISNAATPGYHRQQIYLEPTQGGVSAGQFIGRGVGVSDIRRAIDPSIQARMRTSFGETAAASVESRVLGSIETITGELTDRDLSSALSEFFNAWSELANSPSGSATRAAVVEQGGAVASFITSMRERLVGQRSQLESEISGAVTRTNELLDEIASLNLSVLNAEQGRSEAGNLRDQRDALIDELSQLIDIQVVEQSTGAVDVLVDSAPLVLGAVSRGVEFQLRTVTPPGGGAPFTEARVLTGDGESLRLSAGTIGGLLEQRDASVQRTIDDLDAVAAALIFEVNSLHASGSPEVGVTSLTSERRFALVDQTLALNDPTNEATNLLPFGVSNGSFSVVVTDENGAEFEQTVFVDLDGIRTSDGLPGIDEDTSVEDIRAALNAIPNLNAQINASGELEVFTDAGYSVAFGEDTSGVLATLGINTYFTGVDGRDIGVRGALSAEPGLLVSGVGVGDNSLALAVSALREKPLDTFGGTSLTDRWQESVEKTAVEARAANTRLASETAVSENLRAQEQAVGGVSLDEESLNLILYQQQYSGAARFISTVDELTQLLLSLV